MDRPAPCLVLICPPVAHDYTVIIREGGQRQIWQRVTLEAHQLDYYNLADLWPGWNCWHHAGRYLSDRTVGFLNWAVFTAKQPLPPGF